MPNRDIKESCRTSKNLAELSHGAERMFWRMTTYADDYGRMPADADVIRAACFPRLLDRVSVSNVAKWLDELRRVKLISCYNDSTGHHLLFFLTWRLHQRVRAKHSKYDPPSDASRCQHMTAYVAFRSEDTEVPPSTAVDTVDTALASDGERRHLPAPALKIPQSILTALDQAQRLGSVQQLRTPNYWQAQIRATNGTVEYGQEILKAEAWLQANPSRAPRKDLGRFLHNWLTRAGERS